MTQGNSLTPLLSPHQRRMLEALFQAPCFLLRGMAKPFFSQCGTRPGDSLADALFSIVFADCLADLRVRLGAPLGPTILQFLSAGFLLALLIRVAVYARLSTRPLAHVLWI